MHVQDNVVNPHILRMLEGTFSLDAANTISLSNMGNQNITCGIRHLNHLEDKLGSLKRIQTKGLLLSIEQSKKEKVNCSVSLRKHAFSNILRILPPKTENFQMKTSNIFLISAQNIDSRYSLEPPR